MLTGPAILIQPVHLRRLPGSAADEGTNYIDLDGNAPATISTNIPTVRGRNNYTLSFTYSRNPDGINRHRYQDGGDASPRKTAIHW